MRSLVLFGVLCVAAVKASNYIPVYGEQYVRPGLQYPYMTIPPYPYRQYVHGVVPQYSLPLAGTPVSGVATATPTVAALPLAPVASAAVAPRPLAPGAPGGSVIFSGTGDVSSAGTGVRFFSGQGEVDLAGDFPAGVFLGEGQAQFDGAGQIQVSTVPGVGAVGNFRDFVGQAGFQGAGTVAAAGTGVVNAQGTGVAGLFGGNGVVNVNGVGQTFINTLRGGRSYNVPAYGSVYPSYGYSTYGSQYDGGYYPRSYRTYRPAYRNTNTYRSRYYY